ncbi:hypothetical protein [Rhodoplanes roseus]|uniref:Uncharacterized protein n=1 Tax=Rhodoplanes roseus TaxID=29409 RepID=A0A327KFX7_9BRAD|nr:hypothetical protein [Rhodoplanes roseus]RAI37064.1 hypothetical protein CH341_29910 [Rhodoplanes roseus]
MLDILNWGPVGRWLQAGGARSVPLWRTVLLGRCRGPEACRAALGEAGVHLSADADTLLGRPEFRWSDRKRVVDLATVTPAELGLTRGARWADIRAAAKTLRLGLAPAETGPALRLLYADQPFGERVVLAMQPVGDPETEPLAFALDRDDDGLWLDVTDGHPDVFWGAEDRFAFVRRPARWGF